MFEKLEFLNSYATKSALFIGKVLVNTINTSKRRCSNGNIISKATASVVKSNLIQHNSSIWHEIHREKSGYFVVQIIDDDVKLLFVRIAMKLSKAVAIDIDGVVMKGGHVLKGAKNALNRLIEEKIPFVFVTNGGGTTEAQKAIDMTKKLQIDFRSDQMLLSHTPMKELAAKYGNSQTFVMGNEKCIDVAASYGFNRIVTAEDIYNRIPTIYPNRKPNLNTVSNYDPEQPIEAALVIHDPTNWSLEMQILSDLLVPGPLNGHKQVHLYACNADLVYATEHPAPRFTQGAFVETFRHLFKLQHNKSLEMTYFGKPFPIQYQYAESMLKHEAKLLNLSEPNIFFGIGDNPLSDIRGANGAGDHWKSILVRTGLFQGENDECNDALDIANFVKADIEAAVDCIINYNI